VSSGLRRDSSLARKIVAIEMAQPTPQPFFARTVVLVESVSDQLALDALVGILMRRGLPYLLG